MIGRTHAFGLALALATGGSAGCDDGTFAPPEDDEGGEDGTGAGDDDGGPAGAAPVADAGGSVWVEVGQAARLDGTGSYDPDGRPLLYVWSLLGAPVGSAAAIEDDGTSTATLVPDVAGTYTVELTVDDGTATATDSAHVNAEVGGAGDDDADDDVNEGPAADAGADQSVPVGTEVVLDGGGSTDPDGDPLAFLWSVVSAPGGLPALSGATVSVARFTPEDEGTYLVQLVVNDGFVTSAPDTVAVTATSDGGDGGDDGCGCGLRLAGPDGLPPTVGFDMAGMGRPRVLGAAAGFLAVTAVVARRRRRGRDG